MKFPRLFGKKHGKRRSKPRKKTAARKTPAKRRSTTRKSGTFLSVLKAYLKRALKKLSIISALVALAALLWVLITLPSIDRLHDQNPNPGIVIMDSRGDIINSYGSVYGRYLHYDDMPEHLVEAVLATEDRRFFYHFGFDPIGLIRAIIANWRAGKVVQGGSTLTQQIAKNLFLSAERTYSRKFKELIMAMKLEWFFSKEQLLEIYVNRVYLGAGTFGVDAASRRYFGKSATEINMAEAAILTGLLKAPSRFAPTSSPKRASKRALQILANMVDAGYLDAAKHEQAKAQLAKTIAEKRAPSSNSYYYTDWILDEIPRYIGDITEDIEVETTMSPDMQRYAAQAIHALMDEDARDKGASQAALMAMTPDGAVKALMGGLHYSDSQFNRAVQSHRQPGSAFKLFVYLNAFEQGAYPDMQVMDEPIEIGAWQPGNYGGEYEGIVTVRQAVAASINTVAVRISETYGRNNVIAMARSLGVTSPIEAVPSLALGSFEITLKEMVTAFAHLASGGVSVAPYGITKITNKRGEILYAREDAVPARVLSRQVVAMANQVFSGVIQYGTARRAAIGRPAAGKTGTTSDYKDAWFIGYTPQLVAGVWVGNDEAVPMKRIAGGNIPAAIWGHFMRQAMADYRVMALPTAAPIPNDVALPWGTHHDEEVAPSTGGRHMPWKQRNRTRSPASPSHDREKTREFWKTLGLDG